VGWGHKKRGSQIRGLSIFIFKIILVYITITDTPLFVKKEVIKKEKV